MTARWKATRDPSPAVRQYCEQRRFSRLVREGGLEYLLHRWQRIVYHVSQGYHGLLVEFTNDMDARQIIDELLPFADETERAKVEESVPALDEKFLNATRPIGSNINGQRVEAEYGYDRRRNWWYNRIPTNLGGVYDRDAWP